MDGEDQEIPTTFVGEEDDRAPILKNIVSLSGLLVHGSAKDVKEKVQGVEKKKKLQRFVLRTTRT